MNEDIDPKACSQIRIVRGTPQVRYSDGVKGRAFTLYGTIAARNSAAVEKLLREELAGTGEPIPSRQTVSGWARNENWAAQVDAEWRNSKDWTHDQLRVLALGNAILAAQRRHEILLGVGLEDMDPGNRALLQLKAGELSDRAIERILPLSAMQPAPARIENDDPGLSRGEKEARARLRIVRRHQEGTSQGRS